MSEYQYYEFQTVDNRLSEREMHLLRSYSSRARITPTSFINEYNFGDFRGNADAWMDKSGEETNIGMELQSRFRRLRDTNEPTTAVKRRTVSELLAAAEAQKQEREQEQARKAAIKKAERQRQAIIDREKHLDSLKGQSEAIWANVDALVATRLPKSYDQVVQHLVDLRDLAEREGHQAGFKDRLALLCNRHAAKKTLIERLVKGGL
jgi:hypothetical protein